MTPRTAAAADCRPEGCGPARTDPLRGKEKPPGPTKTIPPRADAGHPLAGAATADLRRLRAGAGALLLLLGAAGCSGLTSKAVGSVVYTTPDNKVVQIDSPSVDGCHHLPPTGAKSVANKTLNDLVLHTGAGCKNLKGTESYYLATKTSNPGMPDAEPWMSFTVVGGNA